MQRPWAIAIRKKKSGKTPCFNGVHILERSRTAIKYIRDLSGSEKCYGEKQSRQEGVRAGLGYCGFIKHRQGGPLRGGNNLNKALKEVKGELCEYLRGRTVHPWREEHRACAKALRQRHAWWEQVQLVPGTRRRSVWLEQGG